MACRPDVELLLLTRLGLFKSTSFSLSSSLGKGAVCGFLDVTSIASADKVSRCLVGLRPVRGLYVDDDEGDLFLHICFWKSCNEYMSFMFGLIHRLLA